MSVDQTKINFSSLLDNERIVKTFEGSFDFEVDTDSVTFDFATQEVYSINHGFTRPVFVELWWSLDGSDWFMGGGNSDTDGKAFVIGYSDSTSVKIMIVENAGLSTGETIYYKVVCGWIPEFDDTNPLIDDFDDFPSNYKRQFQSRYQTLYIAKRGVITLSTASASFTDVLDSEAHGLGYTPNLKCYYEAFPGQVWPLNYGGVRNPYLVSVSTQVEAVAFVDGTEITVDAVMKAANGNVRFWYLLFAPTNLLGTTVNTGADSAI